MVTNEEREQPRFRAGGYIGGEGAPIRIERLGHTVDGLPLVSINGGDPEVLIPADMLASVGRDALDALRTPRRIRAALDGDA